MSLNPKQRRFAHEFSVDHNGAQAAIRAGYSPKTAKEAGSRLMAKVAVRQLVERLDAETNAELGVTAAGALAMAIELWEMSIEQQPKVWKGKPVTYLSELDDGSTVTKTVTELRSASGAAKAPRTYLPQGRLGRGADHGGTFRRRGVHVETRP